MKSSGKNRLLRSHSRITASSVLRRVGVWFLVLVLLNAVGRNLGPLSDATLRLLTGLGGLALLGTGAWRGLGKPDWRAFGTGLGWWGLGWGVLLCGTTPAVRMAGVAPLVLGAHHLLRTTGSRLPGLRGVLALSLMAVTWEIARETVPRLGETLVGISAGWSRFWVWGLLRMGVREGPAAIGGGIVATGLLAVWMMVLTVGGRRTRWVMLGWGSAGVLGMNILFLGLQNGWGGVASTARAQFLFVGLQLVLLVPVLLLLRARLGRRVVRKICPPGRVPSWGPVKVIAIQLALLLTSGLGMAQWSVQRPSEEGAVAFLDAGYVDWKRPEHGRYGAYETGLFGSAHDYLKGAGRRSLVTRDLSESGLKDAAVLVVINPTNRWAPGQVDAIWSFVKRGGGLWVLGDHTDIMGSQAPLNELLKPAGVRFLFDSGFPARPEWRDCLFALRHPVTHRVKQASDAVISVGASLEVEAPSYTVVWGRYGFSDLGNQLNAQGAYLGDYAYQRGEQLGDVALVSAGKVGRGRVLVFGDTSPLQNAALPMSFESLVMPSLDWLSGQDHGVGMMGRWLGALGLTLIGWVVGLGGRAWVTVVGGILLVGGLELGGMQQAKAGWQGPLEGSLALVDLSHGNRVSLAPLIPESIGPFLVTLLRNGFLPEFIHEWSAARLEKASVLVVTAPTVPFGRGELDEVERFVRAGGLLMVNCGWTEKGKAAEQLLGRFGMDVLRVPLGPYPVQRVEDHLPGQAQFINAWPVRVTDPGLEGEFRAASARYRAPLLDTAQADALAQLLSPLTGGNTAPSKPASVGTNAVEVLYQTHDGHPLVVSRRLGEGHVVVIGDTYFLGNDNLETLRYYRKGNLLFLRHVFERTTGRGR